MSAAVATGMAADWALQAACRRMPDPDSMFAPPREQADAARTVCGPCPVALDCLIEAMDSGLDHGVWGGMTDLQRRALRTAHPRVTSWRPVLEAAVQRTAAARSGGTR